MAHELLRFTKASLENTPLMITESQFKAISDFLDNRNVGQFTESPLVSPSTKSYVVKDGVATINIHGALTYRPSPYAALCGSMVSYEGLLKDIDSLCADSTVNTIVLDVASSGGEALSCMYTASELKKRTNKAGKKLIAYVSEQSCSAGYALTSAASEIYMAQDAVVGSIGCVVSLTNDSEHLKKEGYQRQFITSAEGKVPFDKNGAFREGFISDLHDRVMELADNFYALVSDHRGISVDDIKAMNAGVFSSNKAISLNLVDGVKSPVEFENYLKTSATKAQASRSGSALSRTSLEAPVQPSQSLNAAKESLLNSKNNKSSASSQEVVKELSRTEQLKAYVDKHRVKTDAEIKKEELEAKVRKQLGR
ncbi:S49 family peptidase [Vibrio sp. WJH972]